MDPVLLDRLSGEEIEDRILLRINQVPQSFANMLLGRWKTVIFITTAGCRYFRLAVPFWPTCAQVIRCRGAVRLHSSWPKNYPDP